MRILYIESIRSTYESTKVFSCIYRAHFFMAKPFVFWLVDFQSCYLCLSLSTDFGAAFSSQRGQYDEG